MPSYVVAGALLPFCDEPRAKNRHYAPSQTSKIPTCPPNQTVAVVVLGTTMRTTFSLTRGFRLVTVRPYSARCRVRVRVRVSVWPRYRPSERGVATFRTTL